MTHAINIKITPICTACGKELVTAGLEAKSTGHPFERDYPSDRTEQRLFVYACENCFVFKGDLMNIKGQWINSFQERLWEHHTCDWDAGNRNPDYPYQLAVAYFDWGNHGLPEYSVEEAFNRYLENQ